jgi:predicted nucleic acid-binding Zn ribbon protein
MDKKEQRRRKTVRALIYAIAAILAMMIVASLVISQLPLPNP